MTTPQHVVQGYILSKTIFPDNEALAILSGLVSAIPDIVGAYGNRVNMDNWRLYNKFHTFSWWQLLLPSYLLHLVVDKLTHNQEPPYGWKSWTIFAEVGAWALIVLWFML